MPSSRKSCTCITTTRTTRRARPTKRTSPRASSRFATRSRGNRSSSGKGIGILPGAERQAPRLCRLQNARIRMKRGRSRDREGAKDTKQHEEEPLVFFVTFVEVFGKRMPRRNDCKYTAFSSKCARVIREVVCKEGV